MHLHNTRRRRAPLGKESSIVGRTHWSSTFAVEGRETMRTASAQADCSRDVSRCTRRPWKKGRKAGWQAGRQASDAKQRSKANYRRDRVGNSSAYTHPSSDDRNRKRLCHGIGVSLFLLLGSTTWHFVRARCSERRRLSSHTRVC